ncbi:GLE1-domain-containing protein [Violaceomyces palustris]|uniref:GLE1-domain-containing protein n=1 Tax=Violaceomyces palustris TaxID=1673888 RepID=A0ACD0NQ80_9BASI|nr:GLE1-domain-containing protein [Violaceomyces palustris]
MKTNLSETVKATPRPSGRYVYEDSSDEEYSGGSSRSSRSKPSDQDSESDYDALSAGETSSSHASSSSSFSGSFSDSEEEEWPVDPERSAKGGKVGVSARSRSRSKSKSKQVRDVVKGIRLASVADEWDEWDRSARGKVWDRASSTYTSRLKSYVGSGSASSETPPPSGGGSAEILGRPAHLHQEELEEVRKLLSSLDMRRQEEEKNEKQAFEQRNRALWQAIDASILAAEREAQAMAAAEAEKLAAARRQQEEAERKAKEERQAEERRIEEEKAEQKRREEQERKARQEEEERLAKEEKEQSMGGPAGIRKQAQADYERWMSKIKDIKQNVLPVVSQNPELRKQCFAAKRQITPKIGQLTNSRQEVARITTAVGSVLTAARNASSSSGEIYIWILNHLSKCLIRQAEQEVAVKQDTAYPLARVVVWLLLEGHSELAEVLMARLTKKCPWILGFWPVKQPGQEEETYRKALGHAGKDESNEQYGTRMCGIFAFYVAILQTKPTPPPSSSSVDVEKVPVALRPCSLWTWQVRAISPPMERHPLTPALFSTFLEVAGNRCLAIYGRQTSKLWRMVLVEGLRGKKAGFVNLEANSGSKASSTRLTLLLEGWERSGRIEGSTGGSEMEA